jgi:hypothetical protein
MRAAARPQPHPAGTSSRAQHGRAHARAPSGGAYVRWAPARNRNDQTATTRFAVQTSRWLLIQDHQCRGKCAGCEANEHERRHRRARQVRHGDSPIASIDTATIGRESGDVANQQSSLGITRKLVFTHANEACPDQFHPALTSLLHPCDAASAPCRRLRSRASPHRAHGRA